MILISHLVNIRCKGGLNGHAAHQKHPGRGQHFKFQKPDKSESLRSGLERYYFKSFSVMWLRTSNLFLLQGNKLTQQAKKWMIPFSCLKPSNGFPLQLDSSLHCGDFLTVFYQVLRNRTPPAFDHDSYHPPPGILRSFTLAALLLRIFFPEFCVLHSFPSVHLSSDVIFLERPSPTLPSLIPTPRSHHSLHYSYCPYIAHSTIQNHVCLFLFIVSLHLH